MATADLQQHIIKVFEDLPFGSCDFPDYLAEELLADPIIREVIDLAAYCVARIDMSETVSDQVAELLAKWRDARIANPNGVT